MLNKVKHPEAQDAGTIILTGFEPDIVLSSVRTVIEEHQQISKGTQKIQIQRINTDNNSENLPAVRKVVGNKSVNRN
ncbi:MAG: hypothetical protein K8R31_03955 [Bacteroidales bacterium]|nr:hypothetical protein [Bacteroidales bacterium]